MVALGQTITVVNKSGKVVSNSKHIVNVLKEARAAYREKKAELLALRRDDTKQLGHATTSSRPTERKKYHSDDAASTTSSRSPRSPRSRAGSRAGSRRSSYDRHDGRKHQGSGGRDSERYGSRRSKPAMERGYSDSFYESDSALHRDQARRSPTSPLKQPKTLSRESAERRELSRRYSGDDALALRAVRRKPVPGADAHVDMDLAYGELPPPLPVRRGDEEQELRAKMTMLQKMLDEANCLQHSATAMIKTLESNPDAMAAVALTLAEVSNLVSKMAPGALLSLRAAFPAVIALLISPEFLIAAGVGVGITVVAFGSYKIIKRIQNKKKTNGEKGDVIEPEDDGNDLETIDGELSHIDSWRRGIEPAQMETAGASVDGEYATPAAAKQLRADGMLDSKQDIKKRKEDKAIKDKEAVQDRKEAAKDKKDKERAKRDEKKQKDKDDKKGKASAEPSAGEKASAAFQKLFAPKKDKEVVGDFI